MDNDRIARAFDELADLLEVAGENPYKLRAYRNFAETARALPEPLAEVAARGELTEMDGVGKAISAKVEQMLATGTFDALEKARAAVPASLLELMKLPGFGPKTVRTVWEQAKVTNLAELVRACEEDRLAALPGIGKKRQSRALVAALAQIEGSGATLLAHAVEAAAAVNARLRAAGALEVALSGDARRGCALGREALILARDADPDRIAEALASGEPAVELLPREGSNVVFTSPSGARTRVRAVPTAAWVATLLASTGSEAHLAFLEDRAGGRAALDAICARAACEADVYAALDLPFVPPELREGASADVPHGLVHELHGVFHVHTDWSDGKAPLAAMARAAAEQGFGLVGISDHTRAASYANGLDEDRVRAQVQEVARARAEVGGITILHGVEVDIMPDGALDLPDELLAELDFVIASAHSRLDMPHDEMTARMVRAASHPLVTILGHPTGRLLRARRAASFDVADVARAAAANDTYLEINGNAHRLDLSDALAREAAAAGARFVVDPDAHATDAIADAWLGLSIARRAGLTRAQVLNALPTGEIASALAKRKARAVERLGR